MSEQLRVAAAWWNERLPGPSEAFVNAFVAEFTATPLARPYCIGVDYQPYERLMTILRKAGVEPDPRDYQRSYFGCTKMRMWIKPDGSIIVSDGYNAPLVEVRPAEPAPEPQGEAS